MQLIAHTGSACPPDVKRAMIDWFGPVLLESYGGSESGTLCRISSPEWLEHPGSVGRAVEPFRVVVVDEDGNDLGVGETGILAFEAPEGFGPTYHQDPEKTAKAYVRPGAFTLGDMGHVDENGFIFITDRLSDMVVSGGVNLYPSESEAALRDHPGVADVAVIGIPHADLGEQLLALIVPADLADPAGRRRPAGLLPGAPRGLQDPAPVRAHHRAAAQRDAEGRQEGTAASLLGLRPHHRRIAAIRRNTCSRESRVARPS